MRALSGLLIVSWGALSFGAVYPWGYRPLFVAATALGLAGALRLRGLSAQDRALIAALMAILTAIAVQLVPLDVQTLRQISPETDAFLTRYRLGYGGVITRHPLSIDPVATWLALAATAALAILLVGAARSWNRLDAVRFVRGICFLGALLAVIGIAQQALWNGRMYGVWTTRFPSDPFGPFINRNHFAGWILMALPVAFAYFSVRVLHGMQGVAPRWRDRLLWCSSREASETILIGFAVLLMALGLMMSRSRSGILGFLAALTVATLIGTRQRSSAARRGLLLLYAVGVAALSVAWVGYDRIAVRFTQHGVVDLGQRVAIWHDAWAIARRFPLTGTGLNTFGTATTLYQTPAIPDVHFAEAHSDYLQVLAEGGALVSIPVCLAIAVYVWAARSRLRQLSRTRTDYWIRVGALTGLGAVAFQETAEFSLQMPGNAVLFALLAALAVRVPDESIGHPPSRPSSPA